MAATVIAVTLADVLFDPSTSFDLLLSESTPAVNVSAETVTFVPSEIVSELEATEPKFALVPAISKFPEVSVVDAFPAAETPTMRVSADDEELLSKVILAPAESATPPPSVTFEPLLLRNTSPEPAAVSLPLTALPSSGSAVFISIVPAESTGAASMFLETMSVPAPVFVNVPVPSP